MTTNKINFPQNVRGFDWTQPPMEGPPTERTQVGYFCWCNTSEEDNYRELEKGFYVLPDGSAEIETIDKPFSSADKAEVISNVETFAPGTWEPEYPTTSFGSRGGIWIKKRD